MLSLRLLCGRGRDIFVRRAETRSSGVPTSWAKFQLCWTVIAFAALATGCSREAEPVLPDIRPVRAVTVEKQDLGETVTLTGHVRPRDEASLGFRIGGRMIERPVNLGDRVQAGQIIAKLEPLDELNALRSAQAALNSANGVVARTRNDFERQRTLLGQGHTTRARFDQAQQELQTAESQVKDAQAQLQIAQDRVGFTELKADAPGVITAIAAEPGEVVQAGRTIVQVARDAGRDAVFDVPASILRTAPGDTEVAVSLADDPSVQATGAVREVAPQADPITRNFQIRVTLENPPAAMRLGSTVTGRAKLPAAPVIAVPASALTKYDNKPAVWVVDKANQTVAIRTVEVQSYEPSSVIISNGLDNGDIVVTAGVQALYPGRKVRLLGAAS
jgi:RND family efflux transporter MFP subunit